MSAPFVHQRRAVRDLLDPRDEKPFFFFHPLLILATRSSDWHLHTRQTNMAHASWTQPAQLERSCQHVPRKIQGLAQRRSLAQAPMTFLDPAAEPH